MSTELDRFAPPGGTDYGTWLRWQEDSLISLEDAPIGRRYIVVFSDCCVGGHFSAVLTHKLHEPDVLKDGDTWREFDPGQDEDVDYLAFDNGVVIEATLGESTGVWLREVTG